MDLLRQIVLINIFWRFSIDSHPPVDGSRVLAAFLGARGEAFMHNLNATDLLFLSPLFLGGISFIIPVVDLLFRLFAGI